ncbi:hypothetical protein D3C85_1035330 [compost metagenome]
MSREIIRRLQCLVQHSVVTKSGKPLMWISPFVRQQSAVLFIYLAFLKARWCSTSLTCHMMNEGVSRHDHHSSKITKAYHPIVILSISEPVILIEISCLLQCLPLHQHTKACKPISKRPATAVLLVILGGESPHFRYCVVRNLPLLRSFTIVRNRADCSDIRPALQTQEHVIQPILGHQHIGVKPYNILPFGHH